MYRYAYIKCYIIPKNIPIPAIIFSAKISTPATYFSKKILILLEFQQNNQSSVQKISTIILETKTLMSIPTLEFFKSNKTRL